MLKKRGRWVREVSKKTNRLGRVQRYFKLQHGNQDTGINRIYGTTVFGEKEWRQKESTTLASSLSNAPLTYLIACTADLFQYLFILRVGCAQQAVQPLRCGNRLNRVIAMLITGLPPSASHLGKRKPMQRKITIVSASATVLSFIPVCSIKDQCV